MHSTSQPQWWLAIVAPCALFLTVGARARDLGPWENSVRGWYRNLMMPDRPTASRCGEADAYWCDDIHVKGGKTYCTVSDNRDNIKLRRTPVPVGTEIERTTS